MEREEIKHASWNLCSRPGTGAIPLGRGRNSRERDLLLIGLETQDPSQGVREGTSSGVRERGVIRCFLCLLKSKKLISFGQIMNRSTCHKVCLLTF